MDQLRKYIRKIIKESIEEAYPESFNMETFKSLRNHAERNRYAAEHLPKIAAGSSRIVYKIDDEKVLKLAKNDKGIAQNETEIQWGNDSYFGSVLARTFDSDDNALWVEMELARKINKHEFKKLTGFDISDVNVYLRIFEAQNNGRRPGFSLDPELMDRMNEDEFIIHILEFSQSADIEVGDFGQSSSYGVVKRDGHEVLVITDYGLTKDVYSTHYEKPKRRRYASMYEVAGGDNLVCPTIKLTEEIINEVNKFNTSEELLRAGGFSIGALDRVAYGFTSEDIKTLMPKQLKIKWKDDWENVKWEQEKSGLSKKEYASKIDLTEPIDVSFEKGKFFVEDGHHRLFAALVLGKPLNVELEIKDNPIIRLAPELGYDDFHRCVFKQVKSSDVSKEPLEEIERRDSWKKEIEQVAKQLNVPLTNYMGSGVWGIAYEIPGNKVLKITEDDREVNNAKSLIGKKNKLLADIYKIYSIKGYKDKKVIIQEKLAPLTKEYVKALDIFGGYFNEFYNEEWTWGEMRFNGYEEDFDNFLKSAKYNGIPLSDIYSEILQILDEAGSKGIDLTDLHEGNLGLKNGNLAAFDLS